MDLITVRPLGALEDACWLEAGPVSEKAGDGESRWLAKRAGQDPLGFLLAERGGVRIGRLRGALSRATPSLYIVLAHAAREAADLTATGAAFAAYLHREHAMDDAEVMVWDRPELVVLQAAMQDGGFVLERSKVFVERSLVGPRASVDDRFVYRSLAEVGEQVFIETMTKAALGDPFEDVSKQDPEQDFRELVDYAGKKFDAARWWIASVEDEVVGVLLPQAYPGSASEGTIFYLGVLPAFRGRGHGRALHADGLDFLAAEGLTDYVGSTDARNLPMIRVFEANGCKQTGGQRFYRRRSLA